jgi:hypothetical protein
MKTLKQFKEEYQIDERYDKDLDADGNGKLTKKDFELLRAKKKKADCCEEVEELDELSKATLSSYVKKAAGDIGSRAEKQGQGDNVSDNERKELSRHKGISKAVGKLTKEEVEPLDEGFFGRIKSVPEIISAVKAANNGDIEGMKHHAKKYAEKQSSDSSKHAELQKKIYSHLAQKSTHPASKAVAKSLSEESEIEEDCGAYETWDPKHPNFVKNYKKYQKDNSGQGSMKDFIDKEKARPTRLPK